MSGPYATDEEFHRLLYTPVLSDVLDSFGLMRQALRPFVRPLDEDAGAVRPRPHGTL